MTTAKDIGEVIASDFLLPTIERLSQQLRRNIRLRLKVVLDGDATESRISSPEQAGFGSLDGEVRVLASDTAVAGRYKYHLQCIFSEQSDLEGFSGIRLNGAVVIRGNYENNDYSGFMYTYNEWDWGAKVRNF
ncbi:hypothetical protein H0274_14190 [Altererythrobacter sp. CC-YST694]|uniref:hypothetical protein n=1 Tax=Altererythrobacter sp. CC-YST694 TaxID=2755038 RepID=UPI001D031BA0|nr:hypothetical protein [Altererythrobacter sp. CC-YST694]MCB5426410.1 hypothetical protein [Altererythrobacter sp. CC-YST694]